ARVLVALLALALAGAAQADVLVRGAQVFDPDTGTAAVADVLVRGDRVEQVGPALAAPDGVRVVEAAGLALVPGLLDLHTHWTPNTRPSAVPAVANAYLDAGVTTVTDYHQAPEAHAPRRAWLARLAAPTVRFGARISTPLGHGADWADQATTRWVNSPAAARAAVDAIAAYRPDFIKAFTDGWRYGNAADNTSMDEATLAALVDQAHRHGIRVFSHTVTVERAKQAARAGVDLIAHSVLDRAVDDELVALMREHGTAYGPTLVVYEPVRIGDAAPADPGAPVLQRRRANFAVALANVKRLHEAGLPVVVATDAGMPGTPHGRATTRELELLVRAGLSPAEALRAATATADPGAPVLRGGGANVAVALANGRRLHEAGVPVAVATDAGMPGTPHGRATTRELELLVRAGLSPAEALRAATATAARVLGMDDRGRIAPGMRADLVLVEGEPWRDVAAMQRVRRVFLAGVEVTGPTRAARPTTPASTCRRWRCRR